MRGEVGTVRPTRLSHVLLFTSDIDRSIAFYRDALGLRLSDRSQDVVAFMHARHLDGTDLQLRGIAVHAGDLRPTTKAANVLMH